MKAQSLTNRFILLLCAAAFVAAVLVVARILRRESAFSQHLATGGIVVTKTLSESQVTIPADKVFRDSPHSRRRLPAPAFSPASSPAETFSPDLNSKSDESVQVNVAEIAARDAADGINAEVRAREAYLRKGGENLMKGMTIQQVIRLLGKPDTARKRIVDGWEYRWEDVLSPTNLLTDHDVTFGYWPRVGVPFNGKNGQGYQVLYVRLDNDGLVSRWTWTRPTYAIVGSLKRTGDLSRYWEGSHQLSGPPPLEWVPDF